MAAALYHPQLGYYTSGRARIGRAGDFFTNVSIGALFGKLLARQFEEMWRRLGKPAVFKIVEQGANRGDFARDVLMALRENAPECFAAAIYVIVEPANVLREAQAVTLTGFEEKVIWHDSLRGLTPFSGVHFSNELMDAFPVHRVVRSTDGWLEQHVDFADGSFLFVPQPLSDERLKTALASLPDLPAGYQTEVCLEAPDWIADLSTRLERGFVLAIDYGYPRDEYYRPERSEGTLSAYASHQREPNPLARPGEIDLTTHVDFTSLVERGEQAGLRVRGFTDQHHFMVGLGKLHFTDGVTAPREVNAFKVLMHPNFMGRSFKVLCLEKSAEPGKLAGFEFGRDPRIALGL